MNFILCSLRIFIFLELVLQPVYPYRYTMFDFEVEDICGEDQFCKAYYMEFEHVACKFTPASVCARRGYSPIKVNRRAKFFSLMGINGIRNRVAGRLKIANMNILHWDRNLEELAERSLYTCTNIKTVCKFVYSKEYTIGQTLLFAKIPPIQEWYVFPIRKWYSEMNNRTPKPPKSIAEVKQHFHIYKDFTQLIWPTSEFVGCAAARLSRGYMMSCFFHPGINFTAFDLSFIEGYPCTHCSEDRSTCSREFIKLCGLGKIVICYCNIFMDLKSKHACFMILFFYVAFVCKTLIKLFQNCPLTLPASIVQSISFICFCLSNISLQL